MVTRLLRGMYRKRPPLPKMKCIWDVNTVLLWLNELGNTDSLELTWLTKKTAMFLALASGGRCSDLHRFDIHYLTFSHNSATFCLTEPGKSCRPEKLVTFPNHEDSSYCVPSLIKCYLRKTQVRRDDKEGRFFLSTVKPYHPVKPCTIARWLVDVLKGTGIHSFQPHSTRAAATSNAWYKGASMQDILRAADWASEKPSKVSTLRHGRVPNRSP